MWVAGEGFRPAGSRHCLYAGPGCSPHRGLLQPSQRERHPHTPLPRMVHLQEWEECIQTFEYTGVGLDKQRRQYKRSFSTHLRTDIAELISEMAITHPVCCQHSALPCLCSNPRAASVPDACAMGNPCLGSWGEGHARM